jgi:hypothetical protein
MKHTQKKKDRKTEVEVGIPDVDPARRVIDLTAADLIEIVDARLALFLSGGAPTASNDDTLLDRAGAAKYLKISLTKLDLLCRAESDPLPFSLVGDSRRFDREQLRSWALRQGATK